MNSNYDEGMDDSIKSMVNSARIFDEFDMKDEADDLRKSIENMTLSNISNYANQLADEIIEGAQSNYDGTSAHQNIESVINSAEIMLDFGIMERVVELGSTLFSYELVSLYNEKDKELVANFRGNLVDKLIDISNKSDNVYDFYMNTIAAHQISEGDEVLRDKVLNNAKRYVENVFSTLPRFIYDNCLTIDDIEFSELALMAGYTREETKDLISLAYSNLYEQFMEKAENDARTAPTAAFIRDFFEDARRYNEDGFEIDRANKIVHIAYETQLKLIREMAEHGEFEEYNSDELREITDIFHLEFPEKEINGYRSLAQEHSNEYYD